jgi:hypothetical protein
VSACRPSVVLALACAGLVAPAAFAAPLAERQLSPKALYQALLETPVETSALPDGYRSPRVDPVAPSARAKRHHVVGEVGISSTKSGSAGARMIYIVFPTHADALGDWRDGVRVLPKKRLSPPSSVPAPSAMFNERDTLENSAGRRFAVGATILAYVKGNLIVEVETTSTGSATEGDRHGAVALAQFALSHLGSLGGRFA